MKTWGDIFRKHLRKGEDHGSAAFRADEYERKQTQTCIHCHGTGRVKKSPHRPANVPQPTDGHGNIIKGQVS